MPRLLALSLTLALPLALAAGCAGSSDSAPPAASAPAVAPGPGPSVDTSSALAEDVPILAKVSGQDLRVSDPMLGLVNQTALTQLGLGEVFAAQGVTLDPEKHSVILLSLGQCPTGGYSADITALQHKGDELFVEGTATAPADGDQVTQAVTSPYAAVAVEKLPRNVKIRSDIQSLP